MYKRLLKVTATFVARHPRTAICLVIGYIVLSLFEVIPVIEIASDFVVILMYVLARNYIAERRAAGQPIE